MAKKYDFSGYATRANVLCSDGRTILPDAFADNDGKTVPIVWNHDHDDLMNVLGHGILEKRPDGMYVYGSFNGTEHGRNAKDLVDHKDVVALSIFANDLKHSGSNVIHGQIREVSLVLAGANPKAFIDNISVEGSEIQHSADATGDAIIYFDEPLELAHSEDDDSGEESIAHSEDETEESKSDSEETIGDVFNTLSDKQKDVVYVMIAQAIKNSEATHTGLDDSDESISHSDDESGVGADISGTEDNESDTKMEKNDDASDPTENEEENQGGEEMKHNVFEAKNEKDEVTTLSHADQLTIISDGKKFGSLRESALQHGLTAVSYMGSSNPVRSSSLQHGITNVDYLFPDAQAMDTQPIFIARDQTWVSNLMAGFRHTPFSRIKSMAADLTADDARAKGYLKGNLKQEEVFSLLKRTTSPTTVYKKQKIDRDDVIDITGFDVIAWLKSEMRLMLDEEIARAALVGDGRLGSSEDKINESNIRPIWTDAELYTIKYTVAIASADQDDANKVARAFIRACVKSRKGYKGSGNPILYTTEDVLTDCLLIEDTTNRTIYTSIDHLATALRVSAIVTVPVMEDLSRTVDSVVRYLMGIIVNPRDYTLGADKGGAVNMFDDFDIDYNQQKYLIETRASGALTVPYSAIVLEKVVS